MNLPDLNQLGPDADDFTVPGGALSSIKRRAAKRRRTTAVAGAALAGTALFAGGFGIASLQSDSAPGQLELAGDAELATTVAADPTDPIRRGRLRKLTDCASAKSAIVEGAVRRASEPPLLQRWPQNFWAGQAPDLTLNGRFESTEFAPEILFSRDVSAYTTGDSVRVDVSEQNAIVEGVVESDLLVSDGTHMIAVRRKGLVLIDLDGGNDPTITAGHPAHEAALGLPEVYLDDGVAWVVTPIANADTGWIDGRPGDRYSNVFGGHFTHTHIEKLRIDDDAALTSVGSVTIGATLRSSRSIDGTMHFVVVSAGPEIDLVVAQGDSAAEAAAKANRELLRDVPLRDWVPRASATIDGETIDIDLLDCERMHIPTGESRFGVTSVLTISADEAVTDIRSATLFAESTTISASTDRLYLSSTGLGPVRPTNETEALEQTDDASQMVEVTDLHSFALTGDEPATYLASGSVRGTVLNEFGIDEYQGVVRVASTYRSDAGQGRWTNDVTTLSEADDGELRELGRVTGLGPDETVRGVRFIGDRGYIVTFRETDPLYVVDLSDPSEPSVEGELKITGFSSYLHPLSDGRLLGVGSEADLNGRVTGAKVSLFDVSDPTNPTTINSIVYPNSVFLAASDHLAVTFWEDESLLALPGSFLDHLTNSGASEGGRPGAKLFRVDDTIGEIGELPVHKSAHIVRTIIVGDEIWSMSEMGLSRRDRHDFDYIGYLRFDQ